MADSSEGHCVSCEKTTRKHCSRCTIDGKDHCDAIPLTFYCSIDCQKTDFKSYKSICWARQQLFRGAELVKQAFLIYREVAFDMEIEDVKVMDGELHFYEPLFDESSNSGPLYAFPEDLVANAADKEALLAYCACGDALRYMFQFIGKVLSGIKKSEQRAIEVTNYAPVSNLKVHRYSDGKAIENPENHIVLAVSLEQGNLEETYMIDLSGAQHHQYHAVLPFTVYTKRVGPVLACKPFGTQARRDVSGDAYGYSPCPATAGQSVYHDSGIHAIQAEIGRAFNTGVEKWEADSGKTVTAMLRQKEKEFHVDAKKLLANLKEGMESYLAWWRKQSDPPFRDMVHIKNGHVEEDNLQEEDDDSQSEGKGTAKSSTEYKPTPTKTNEEGQVRIYPDDSAVAKLLESGAFSKVFII